jgi:hypothetical protein
MASGFTHSLFHILLLLVNLLGLELLHGSLLLMLEIREKLTVELAQLRPLWPDEL